jgi:hypothetical protein
VLLCALNLRAYVILLTNIVQNEALAAKDTELAAKDAELEQALATVTAAKVYLFRTISLSQRH